MTNEVLMLITRIVPAASRTDLARNEQATVTNEFTPLEIDFFARAAELYSTDDPAEDGADSGSHRT